MKQLEIDYFWPLTEQIPLDLDYTECEQPKIAMPSVIGSGGYTLNVYNEGLGDVTIAAAKMNIDVETTTFKVKQRPNLCSRIFYRCLGIKWELK